MRLWNERLHSLRLERGCNSENMDCIRYFSQCHVGCEALVYLGPLVGGYFVSNGLHACLAAMSCDIAVHAR